MSQPQGASTTALQNHTQLSELIEESQLIDTGRPFYPYVVGLQSIPESWTFRPAFSRDSGIAAAISHPSLLE